MNLIILVGFLTASTVANSQEYTIPGVNSTFQREVTSIISGFPSSLRKPTARIAASMFEIMNRIPRTQESDDLTEDGEMDEKEPTVSTRFEERAGPLGGLGGMFFNPISSMFAGSPHRRIENILMQMLAQMQQLASSLQGTNGHHGQHGNSMGSSSGGFFDPSNSQNSFGQPSFSSNGFSTGNQSPEFGSSSFNPMVSTGNGLNRPDRAGNGMFDFNSNARLPSLGGQQDSSSITGSFNRPGSSSELNPSMGRPSSNGISGSFGSSSLGRPGSFGSSSGNGLSSSIGDSGSSVNRPVGTRPSGNNQNTIGSNSNARNENSLGGNSSNGSPSVALPSTSTSTSTNPNSSRPTGSLQPSNNLQQPNDLRPSDNLQVSGGSSFGTFPLDQSSGSRSPSVTASPFTLSPFFNGPATRSPPIYGLETGFGSDGSEFPLKSLPAPESP